MSENRSKDSEVSQDPSRWVADLLAAGWEQMHLTLYRAPCGCYFRGPYHAWVEMNGAHLADHVASGVRA